MQPIPPLANLGRRIVILGPSNSGKSTLAAALAEKLGLPAVYLDRFYHLPNTDWVARSKEDFIRLHQAAIAEDAWIMDGNYRAMRAERLQRATGVVVLDDKPWFRLVRYFNRTLLQPNRHGTLEGNRDSIKWQMIKWVGFDSRRNGQTSRDLIRETQLPYVFCNSMAEVKALYRAWDLTPSSP
jgi:adenylate kinase family enzyme